jgi:hypothetical protein
MASKEVTRATLRRDLAVNAATKPINVIVPAGVLVAGLLLGTPWLLPLAAVVYVVLAVMTIFDGREAERVGQRAYGKDQPGGRARIDARALADPIRTQVLAARSEAEKIDRTVASADLPFAAVREEVDRLVTALEATARRAQRLYDYLAEQPRAAELERRANDQRTSGHPGAAQALAEQASVLRSLNDQLMRAGAEMEEVNASLGAVHGRLVQAAVASEAERDAELAGDVRDLRRRLEGVTEALESAT